MPYVLQQVPQEECSEQYEDVQSTFDPSQLPPAAVAAQSAASVVAASLRALAARQQSKAPCTLCEKKKRLQRLMALRQRG
jgi:hypothetical protein